MKTLFASILALVVGGTLLSGCGQECKKNEQRAWFLDVTTDGKVFRNYRCIAVSQPSKLPDYRPDFNRDYTKPWVPEYKPELYNPDLYKPKATEDYLKKYDFKKPDVSPPIGEPKSKFDLDYDRLFRDFTPKKKN